MDFNKSSFPVKEGLGVENPNATFTRDKNMNRWRIKPTHIVALNNRGVNLQYIFASGKKKGQKYLMHYLFVLRSCSTCIGSSQIWSCDQAEGRHLLHLPGLFTGPLLDATSHCELARCQTGSARTQENPRFQSFRTGSGCDPVQVAPVTCYYPSLNRWRPNRGRGLGCQSWVSE
jgi:hypothetical protein